MENILLKIDKVNEDHWIASADNFDEFALTFNYLNF